jgi:FkbM family methyltransferase
MDYEGMLEKLYSTIIAPGDCAIDLGAHSGRHCKPMAALVGEEGTVIAFEPNPVARGWLVNNVALEIEAGIVVVHPYALSNVTQKMSFTIANERPEESGLKKREYNGPTTTQEIEVDVVTLDSVLTDTTDAPAFIKIDVEGAEFDALKGANHTIATHKPIIAFEFGQSSYQSFDVDPGEVYDYLDCLGYRLFSILGDPLDRTPFMEASRVQSFWDYIACPVEKLDLLEKAFLLVPKTETTPPAPALSGWSGLMKKIKTRLGL